MFLPRTEGIVMLKDREESKPEVFVDELPKEAYLIPPEDFVFDETKNN